MATQTAATAVFRLWQNLLAPDVSLLWTLELSSSHRVISLSYLMRLQSELSTSLCSLCPKKIEKNSSSLSDTAGSILTLARLYAFTAIVVSCRKEDCTDSAGGHRLKLYYERFSCFLLLSFIDLIERNSTFVHDWCPIDLIISSLSVSVKVWNSLCG